MLVSGIKSRPRYAPLSLDPTGRHHVLVADANGATAILRVLDALDASTSTVCVLWCPGPSAGDSHVPGDIRRLEPRARLLQSEEEVRAALGDHLSSCRMGTRLYLAGSEGFIGRCVQIADRFGLKADEVQREHCGTAARRVFCTHCRSILEDVTTNIVRCPSCERALLVRDHYSRRLAAFMAVQVDAEAPGDIPAAVEIYR